MAASEPSHLTVPRRFVGPLGAAHGGYLGGRLARIMPEPSGVEVRLRAPTPMETPLEIDRTDGSRLRLLDGHVVYVECRPSDPGLEVGPLVGHAEAERAGGPDAWRAILGRLPAEMRQGFAGLGEGDRCFACMPRADGLNLFVGRVEGRDLLASAVAFPPDLVPDGLVPPEMVWAAVDCPSMWAGRLLGGEAEREELAERVVVTGTLTVRIRRAPRTDDRTSVQAWRLGREGRKLFGAAVLVAEDGEILAEARQTAVVL